MKSIQFTVGLGAVAGAMALATSAFADIQKYNFEVVGTWGFLENWKEYESKFWTEQLPKASGSKIKVGNMPGGGAGFGYIKREENTPIDYGQNRSIMPINYGSGTVGNKNIFKTGFNGF